MSTYDLVADLPLQIDDYDLEGLAQNVSSDFERKSTIIHLRGAGEEGLGEDVVYDAVDHEIAQRAGPVLPLAGDWTLRSLSEHLATLDLFPEPPQARGVAAVSHLGVRVGGARSRVAPGRQAAARGARAAVPAADVRRLAAARRAALAGAGHTATRALPDAALQARSDRLVGRGADRRARRDGRRRLASTSRVCTKARPSTSPPTRSSTPASSRPSRTPGSRIRSSRRRSTSC